MDKTVVALGMFDGVHLGHRSLIQSAVAAGRDKGMQCMVYTFQNHPMTVFKKGPKLLMTGDERIAALLGLGADRVIADAFDEALAKLTPAQFVQMLMERLNMGVAVAGYNYSFGSGGTGSAALLHALGSRFGFEVIEIPPVLYKGETVSSSRIRKSVEEGDVALAGELMGGFYALTGKVVTNQRIGSAIGFPTANISVAPEKTLPKSGVYATQAYVHDPVAQDEPHSRTGRAAVTNIGTNPTVHGREITVETHIMGFAGDIYGETLTVAFKKRIRDEMAFDSVDALKAQIKKDIAEAEK